ncbi:hypothetical protein [Terrarubrum flagellatum]|uniref:hypothetical protein n=1 Tax=Terrirubrum flagellatum TaxID=2895980 RepID=UPI003144FDB9
MKLNPTRINQTLSQFDAQPLPETHPAMPQFNELFGEHTFFINENGLSIVEPDAPIDGQGKTGRVVKIASWIDESRSRLAPHEREFTDTVILFGKAA